MPDIFFKLFQLLTLYLSLDDIGCVKKTDNWGFIRLFVKISCIANAGFGFHANYVMAA